MRPVPVGTISFLSISFLISSVVSSWAGSSGEAEKELFEIGEPHKKVTKIHMWTCEEYFLPLGLLSFKRCSLSHSASLHSEVTLLWKVLASAISHLYPHDQLSPQSAQNPSSRPAWCCCCRSDSCLRFSRVVVAGTRPRLRRITMTIAKYTIMFKIHLRQAGDP